MTVYDFSSGFNLLNQGINSLGEALNNRTNAQAYSGIGQDLQNGDYRSAAARAWAMGNPDLALKLQSYTIGGGGYPATTSGDGTAQPAALPGASKPTDVTQPAVKAPTAAAPGTTQPSGLPTPIVGKWAPPGGTAQDVATYIYNGAIARGIDPVTALRVAKSEGLNAYSGDKGMSFGPFQLYTGGGLGNEFTKATGLDPSNPATWKQQVDFALDTAARKGSWADWHGAQAIGLPNNAGLQNARPLGVSTAGAVGAAVPGSTQLPTQPAGTRFGAGGFAGVGAPGAAPAAVASAAPAAPQLAQAPPVAPVPAIRPPTARAYAGIPLNAPEQGVDAAARALATNLPGAPSPQQQAAAAANPPGLGDLLGLLRGQPNAPAPAPAPGPSPGANIPTAYGQPQPAAPPAPAGPAAQLQPIVQALQSGRLTMRELLANPQGFGLPDPRQAASQPVWQVLAAAATSTGRGVGQGPPTPAMGAQAFAGAIPTATSTGEAPQPPVRPPDSQPPPQMASLGPDESQAGRGPGRNALEDANAGRLPGYPENAPLPPPRPADIGRPFPQPPQPVAKQPPATVPANIQPRSSRVPTPQGPYAPPGGPGSAFSRDFGPGAGQMWGPSGGVMAAGPGGVTPAYLGGPTPQNITPAARAAQLNAFALPQPGRGTMPAALPPGGAPAGRGGGLGGALSGLGGGLINLLSMTPPGGVPGMITPAQTVMGGQNAPIPAPPWLRQQQPGQAPGMFSPSLPTMQGPAIQPAAAPGVAGAPGQPAQPAGPGDPIDAQIAQVTARMQQMRSIAVARSPLGEAYAKPFEDEANRLQEQINDLVKAKTAAGYKTSETEVTTTADMAKERGKELSAAYDKAVSPGGPIGLIKNVQQMKANLDNMQTGYGAVQPVLQSIGNTIAGLTHDPSTMDRQLFEDLSNQEVLQLAQTLIGQQRLTRNEFEQLRKGQLNTGQQKEVLSKLLDAAVERGSMALDQQNRAVENYKKAFPKYAGQADQFTVPDEIRPDKPAYKGPKPTGFGAGGLKPPEAADIAGARQMIASGRSPQDVAAFMRLHGVDPTSILQGQ